MESRRLLSALARQIEIARRKPDGAEGSDPLRLAVFRSLRLTYLAISTGLDPRKDAGQLFTLTVSHTGEHLLLHGGQPVPVNAPYLASLFWSAGIELVAGQTLLLETEIAQDAVEEALGRLALEQALADRDRLRRREALDDGLVLPPQKDLEALRVAEERTDELWDRKIELVAASLIADESLERSQALQSPDDPENEAA